MKHLLTPRLALALALCGAVAPLAIVGCGGGGGSGGGGSNNNNGINNDTSARISFSSNETTSANLSPLDLSGPRPTVTASTTGVHTAILDDQELLVYHVAMLAKTGELSRALTFVVERNGADKSLALNPPSGRVFNLSVEGGYDLTNGDAYMNYDELNSTGRQSWISESGLVTVTDVTSTAQTLTAENVVMTQSSSLEPQKPKQRFTLSGKVRVRKAEIATESSDVFYSHMTGFNNVR